MYIPHCTTTDIHICECDLSVLEIKKQKENTSGNSNHIWLMIICVLLKII